MLKKRWRLRVSGQPNEFYRKRPEKRLAEIHAANQAFSLHYASPWGTWELRQLGHPAGTSLSTLAGLGAPIHPDLLREENHA